MPYWKISLRIRAWITIVFFFVLRYVNNSQHRIYAHAFGMPERKQSYGYVILKDFFAHRFRAWMEYNTARFWDALYLQFSSLHTHMLWPFLWERRGRILSACIRECRYAIRKTFGDDLVIRKLLWTFVSDIQHKYACFWVKFFLQWSFRDAIQMQKQKLTNRNALQMPY